jgi:hypothetical protein
MIVKHKNRKFGRFFRQGCGLSALATVAQEFRTEPGIGKRCLFCGILAGGSARKRRWALGAALGGHFSGLEVTFKLS